MRIEADWLDSRASRAVICAFSDAGKSAYFVGGCVRNHLLGVAVGDLDISTSALPDETLEIAEGAGLRAIPTGIDHGTVTVISGGIPYEVTTFRRDVDTDGRRAVVAFSNNIADDARRRDFTMNALYVDISGLVIDPLGGISDLRARRVRFIENADQRIAEDYLRILRFFRFYAWYGNPNSGIDREGLAACAAAVDGINTLSKERIGAEMRKLLSAPNPAPATTAMAQCGALGRILPGADIRFLASLVHLEVTSHIPPDWNRRLAVLGGVNQVERLRLSRAEAKHLKSVIQSIADGLGGAETGYRLGKSVAIDAAIVLAASTSSHLPRNFREDIERGVNAVFPIAASDLQPEFNGRELGERLKTLESAWIETNFQASRSELLD